MTTSQFSHGSYGHFDTNQSAPKRSQALFLRTIPDTGARVRVQSRNISYAALNQRFLPHYIRQQSDGEMLHRSIYVQTQPRSTARYVQTKGSDLMTVASGRIDICHTGHRPLCNEGAHGAQFQVNLLNSTRPRADESIYATRCAGSHQFKGE